MAGGEVRYMLDSDGKCKTCKKSALSSFVTCFFCQEKFHAVGCSDSPGICTQTFFGMYKPLSDKSGANANRFGNFLFTCDNCLTKFENERAATSSDKLVTMQNQINDLNDNRAEIKQILLGKRSVAENIPPQPEASSPLPSAWNSVASSNDNSMCTAVEPPHQDADTPRFPKEKEAKSILVIEKSDDKDSDSQTLKEVESIIVDNRIGVKKTPMRTKMVIQLLCAPLMSKEVFCNLKSVKNLFP